ncbi:GNAT family N-acetyltransferase [Flavobacterium luminosum]|uniref:GNAT family N-acetyltransferase n=1 Tax=Flavobacterium luminosum TaxID=2949086 RepID=A0ABT0TQX5_9FLAO|nr:GNAT family N-acetyltransferase [Flavobacterium sp. HXWNR70]MCL9809904.1 GNAT family N-acetyltransferase [Flavobacterium sp. HXWNR70]
MQLKELTTLEEMLAQLETIHYLYPKMTAEKYELYLRQMIPHNYKQLIVLDGEKVAGITGFWKGIKLWSGPYLEIDNFVVHPDYRGKGIGKLLTDYIDAKAHEFGSTMIVLDAYVENYTAHRFYYNQGFAPRGYHFIKTINKNQLS